MEACLCTRHRKHTEATRVEAINDDGELLLLLVIYFSPSFFFAVSATAVFSYIVVMFSCLLSVFVSSHPLDLACSVGIPDSSVGQNGMLGFNPGAMPPGGFQFS